MLFAPPGKFHEMQLTLNASSGNFRMVHLKEYAGVGNFHVVQISLYAWVGNFHTLQTTLFASPGSFHVPKKRCLHRMESSHPKILRYKLDLESWERGIWVNCGKDYYLLKNGIVIFEIFNLKRQKYLNLKNGR